MVGPRGRPWLRQRWEKLKNTAGVAVVFSLEMKGAVVGRLVFYRGPRPASGSRRVERGEVSFCWREGRSLVCLWQGKGGKDEGEWLLGTEGERLLFLQEREMAACSKFKLR